ncbi:MAG: tripartite tricarboxylate transporter substrate binding protein [Hylemonella sp.]|nr:tripartite tricarboxylate transporter substrate binding protein [Burkholderiaceae bacterium]MDO9090065.1 tripartite tricarboxylate transporter substrate binding protein [Burkholderiaceae bacterium]MDP1936767.1 tripartite tricarboxylate transporter substrate binding protein [Hylemonella sp.]
MSQRSMPTRRTCLSLALGAASIALLPAARAQAYPNKPVKIIVGFAPGGANDLLARVLAEPLGQALGQSVIIENKPGADAIVAAEFVARSPADGYTLFFAGSGPITINPAIYAKLPYDAVKDFAPISVLGTLGVVIAARPTLGAKTVADVIRMAKERPQGLSYGSGSTSFQMAAEMFARQAGIKLLHVPYKGGGPAVQALAAGDIDLMFADSASVLALATSGRVVAVGMTSEPRPAALPNLAIVAESGLPGFDFNFFVGLMAPGATPPDVVQRLYEACSAALARPAIRDRMMSMGIRPVGTTPQQTVERVRRDIDHFTAIAQAAKIRGGG